MAREEQLRRELCEIGRRMWMRGLVAATDGNFSVRLTESLLLATPSGVNKGFMSPGEIVKIDLEGQPVEGTVRPSSEIKMHLAIYQRRPDVCAVVHGHPPTATGFAAVRVVVPTEILTEAATFLGKIALIEYATPGSEAVAEALVKYVKEHNVFLLANHGAVTVGRDLLQATYRMEALEQAAKSALTAHLLGGAQAIEPEELAKLQQTRAELGLMPREESCLPADEAPWINELNGQV